MQLQIILLVAVVVSIGVKKFMAYKRSDKHPGLGALAD